MDKYPVLEGRETVGELTVTPEKLYTAFDVSCSKREGLWSAWAIGETGTLRIGVPEPEGEALRICRRFSRELTAPVGTILRGELRPLGEEREHWTPLENGETQFQSGYLRSALRQQTGVLICREQDGFRLAFPRDDRAPFPLETMFCFAQSRRLKGREYWVFSFDENEWPVF